MVLKFREIPPDVWQAVRGKWANVLKNGWQDDTWERCAMCEFLDAYVHGGRGCDICPIEVRWCNSGHGLFFGDYESESTWRKNVDHFIGMCDKILKKSNLSTSERGGAAKTP